MLNETKTEQSVKRNAYFAAIGKECPSGSESRLKMAVELIQQETPDYNSALMLFDKNEDGQNSAWLLFMAVILSNDINSQRFNPEVAKLLYEAVFSSRNDPNRLHFNDEKILLAMPGIDSIHKALDRSFEPSPVEDDLAIFRQDDLYIKNFIKAIIDVQILRKSILEKRSGGSFFAFAKAVKEKDSLTFDDRCEAMVVFKDPWSDYTDSSSLSLVANSVRFSDSEFYSPKISENLFIYSAVKFPEYEVNNCSSAAFRLGFHYGEGYTGRVDHNASIFWFEVAKKLGQGMAPLQAYNSLLENDERANQDDEEFKSRLEGLLVSVEELGQKCANHSLVQRYAYGRGKWDDQEKVNQNYENILSDTFWAPPQLKALYAYALRSHIFKDTGRTPEFLIGSLENVRDAEDSFYDAELLTPVENFKKILERAESPRYRRTSDKAFQLVRSLYTHEISYDDFLSKVDHLYTMTSVTNEALRDAFWVCDQLAQQENWYLTPWVNQEFRQANLNYLQLDDVEVRKSALMMGPFYNPIDPQNGLPILGQYLPASSSNEEVLRCKLTYGAYVPQPGIIKLKSVHGEADGSISFQYDRSPTAPAMLLDEDFHVVMALAFGSPKAPIWPTLSLEKQYKGLLDDEYEMFKAKIWDPVWLGHTDFGKTLYIVDRLTGQMTWSPKSYTVSLPENSFDPEFPAYVKGLLEDLRFTGGADRLAQGKIINVSPEHIPVPIVKKIHPNGKETWSIEITDIKMRVNGSYVRKINGVEDRSVSWNDTQFAQGRLTQRLTDHYNDIALMMPVFERARQLMALLYSVMELREKGFIPNAQTLLDSSNILKGYENMPPLRRNELVLKPQPFVVDFNY